MSKLIETIPTEVAEAVSESLNLFRQASFRERNDRYEASQPLPSLLELCEKYIAVDRQQHHEPVRLIHHFACTGGTLIIKCLACSPNVQVLSELDPLSTKASSADLFNPTDLIQLLEHGNRRVSMDEKLVLFLTSFAPLYDSCVRKGLRLLIRDHTHSHFCVGNEVPERPTLGEIFSGRFPTLSAVTVRHPLDSWLSLKNNDWIDFHPATPEEYAKRYLAFLEEYDRTLVFKYEDFVERPDETLAKLCRKLDLPYPSDFRDLFGAHRFSGDSGRRGSVICPRPRRSLDDNALEIAKASKSFVLLCEKLEYEL